MASVAPKVHKSLSADAPFALIHKAFSCLRDHRSGTSDISLADTLMPAFAIFSLKAPSLLAFDKERAADNVHHIYSIERVLCDVRRIVALCQI